MKLPKIKIKKYEFDHVYGSRKMIKDVNNPTPNWYGSDLWSEEGRKLDSVIPENYVIYGELIGWTPDNSPIQKRYTYQVPEGTCDLYVYRIAIVNGKGRITDLSWEQVKEFCADNGLHHVPELWQGQMKDLVIEDFLDKKFHQQMNIGVPLAKESPCDEGVCVRADGLAPYILKAKGPGFFRHESKMLDEGTADLEETGEG